MNCKNCGAPVDGHIACPKCGQIVDFSGGVSKPEPRSSYGINWGTEEETPAAKPVSEAQAKPEEQPVVDVQAKLEEKKQVVETPVGSEAVKPEPEKPVVETSVKPEPEQLIVETSDKSEPVKPEPATPTPAVAESKTDTSEDESEELSIFDTLGEAMDNIAEEFLDVSDDIKEDIADVVANISDAIASAYPEEDDDEEDNSAAVTSSSIAAEDKEEEPYRYKENKYEFSGSASSADSSDISKGNRAKSRKSFKGKLFAVLMPILVFMLQIVYGVRTSEPTYIYDTPPNIIDNRYLNSEYARQELYNNTNLNIYGLSAGVEQDSVVYVYADLGKIYKSGGERIDIFNNAIVKSDLNHKRIAYYQEGQLFLVDKKLEPEIVANKVKDFQISSNGDDLAYIKENNDLIYRKYDNNDYEEYTVASNVDSFVFAASTSKAGFLYLGETDEGKALFQCDRDGNNQKIIASGECKPISVAYDLLCTFYLDENNHLHRYYDGSDEDIEYDVTINDNSEYITSNDKSAILVNNIAVDGKIYCANKFTKELSVIDEPGLSEVDIYEATKAVVALAVTYKSDEGLVEVKFGPGGSTKYVITESTNVDCFAVNAKEDVVLYKLDNQLYKWSRTETTDEVIDEDASAIDNISVSSPGEFYYLKGNELYYYSTITHTHEPVLLSDEVDRIFKYTDNDGQVTMGFAKIDSTQYILTTNGNYIQE